MMLLLKAWRETKVRWLMSAVVILWACSVVVLFHSQFGSGGHGPDAYRAHIWDSVYKGSVRDLFIILTLVLGLGGLSQERKHGSVGFTLALPVSRSRLVVARAILGLIEVTGLALLPVIAFGTLSPLAGESFAASQALSFSAMWVGGGSVMFGLSMFLSTIIDGEYSPWLVAFIAITGYSVIVNVPPLGNIPGTDVFKLMNGRGMDYFRIADHTFVGPLPWFALLVLAAVTALFIGVACRIVERQDF